MVGNDTLEVVGVKMYLGLPALRDPKRVKEISGRSPEQDFTPNSAEILQKESEARGAGRLVWPCAADAEKNVFF